MRDTKYMEIMKNKETNIGNLNTGNLNTGNLNTGNYNTGNCNTGHRNTGHRNTGDLNTGDLNTGDRNTGQKNTGDQNIGQLNTGNWNTGYRDTGNWNTGNWNTGDRNTGHSNFGDLNTGNCNTGHRNTRDLNTGNRNTGDRNTGDLNTGHLNTGNWNTGNCNTGYFCEKDGPVIFFDQPCDMARDEAIKTVANLPGLDILQIGAEWVQEESMSESEKSQYPCHVSRGGFLRKHTLPLIQSMPLMWEKLTPQQRQKWLDLPNFDAGKFMRMYGIDTRKPPAKKATIRLASGEIVTGEIVE
jgi:hypothetical protein